VQWEIGNSVNKTNQDSKIGVKDALQVREEIAIPLT
jgi:hypothetical protein